MKAEGLMVGDLLTFKDCVGDSGFPILKVNGILPDTLFVRIDYSDADDEVDYEDIIGIPITPEILEKNGFEKLGYEGWEFDSEEETRRDCPNYQIIWRRDYPRPHNTNLKITSFIAGIGNFRSFDIKFVHELQHALRICKIEKEIVI